MYDWTYIFVLIGMVLSLLASAKVKRTYAKYAQVYSRSGLTGAQAARKCDDLEQYRDGEHGNADHNECPGTAAADNRGSCDPAAAPSAPAVLKEK